MTADWWIGAIVSWVAGQRSKAKLCVKGESIAGIIVSLAFSKITDVTRDSDNKYDYDAANDVYKFALIEPIQKGTKYVATAKTNSAIPWGAEVVPDAGFVVSNADTAQVFTVQAVADVAGSLNDTYFTCSLIDANGDQDDYYVWMNINSAGTDPNLPGRTGIEVAAATGATANTVAAAIQAAMDAITGWTATVSTDTVTVTNDNVGECQDALDGPAAPTGFTITTTIQGNDAAEIKTTGVLGVNEKDITATASTEKLTIVGGR
jgi:hypothetical protein